MHVIRLNNDKIYPIGARACPHAGGVQRHHINLNMRMLATQLWSMVLGTPISRGVKDPSGAVQKRSHAVHPKVPGIIPGATWHPVAYCDTWHATKTRAAC